MKIETKKGIIIIKEFNELVLENKGKQLTVTLDENGFELSLDHFKPLLIDKDLNEIIKQNARDMAVVFATKELWNQNPDKKNVKTIPKAFYDEVAERFDNWEINKSAKEELYNISVSLDTPPLFCETPSFTNMIIHSRCDNGFITDTANFSYNNGIIDKEKEFSIEDYLSNK